MSIILLIVAIVGIFIMLKVSAWIGFIIYMISFAFCLHELKSKISYEDKFSVSKLIKDINKENLLSHGINTIVVLILPIVIILGLYSWIILDSIRSADFISNMFY